MSDGVRAMHLKPSNMKAHVCYIRSLEAAGFKKRATEAIQTFVKDFPEEKDILRTVIDPCAWCVCVHLFVIIESCHERACVCVCVVDIVKDTLQERSVERLKSERKRKTNREVSEQESSHGGGCDGILWCFKAL